MVWKENIVAFLIYITFFSLEKLTIIIYLAKKAFLLTKKVTIFDKYSDFSNVFLERKALVLPKQTELNKHFIKLKNDKQLPYKSIYSWSLIELETLKMCIKIYLKIRFIQPSKISISILILLNKKLDNSFYLYINYQGLNNLIIKNQYLLLLIDKFLD